MSKINSNDKNWLNIIIVGCGKVGTTLVSRLCEEGHDVTVIDKDGAIIQTICETHDVLGIIGNGSSISVQQEAGIENADLLIAVTESDELNLLCCTLAKKVSRCSVIARVRNPDYSNELHYLRDKLGISMLINPEFEAANEISRLLRFPMALSINSFAKGHAEMIKFKIPEDSELCGKALYQMNSYGVLICAVERGGELYIPNGSFVLQAGDIVRFTSTPQNASHFFKSIGLKVKRVSNSMIIGGGKTSYYLAKHLLEMGIKVKIIELDMKRCEELSVLLDDALIICGDGADEALLRREGLDEAESFIALTGMDEENILLSLHAKENPNIKTITKINRITFNKVIENLELGSVVYPKYITAETIIKYVRGKKNSIGSNIETLYHIFDDRAEAIEFRVEKNSPISDIPLKDLNLKKNLLISGILRKDKFILPSGNDEIKENDRVIVVTMHTGFQDISDIIEN